MCNLVRQEVKWLCPQSGKLHFDFSLNKKTFQKVFNMSALLQKFFDRLLCALMFSLGVLFATDLNHDTHEHTGNCEQNHGFCERWRPQGTVLNANATQYFLKPELLLQHQAFDGHGHGAHESQNEEHGENGANTLYEASCRKKKAIKKDQRRMFTKGTVKWQKYNIRAKCHTDAVMLCLIPGGCRTTKGLESKLSIHLKKQQNNIYDYLIYYGKKKLTFSPENFEFNQ